MTYIELFDPDVPENLCTCLATPAQRVVLIGDDLELMQRHSQRYRQIFLDRGTDVAFVCHSVNKNRLESILQLLTRLVQTYEDCILDLTGGEDLFLVAAGIIAQRFPEKNIRMHRFNLRTGTLYDCSLAGNTRSQKVDFFMSIRENVRAYGGVVAPGGDHWELTEEFQADIRTMWNLCRKDVRLWNAQVDLLAACPTCSPENPLARQVSISRFHALLQQKDLQEKQVLQLLKNLQRAGILTAFFQTGETLYLTYKSNAIRYCLTKAGQLLELWIYMAARQAQEADGTATYQDVRTGVSIDWDGKVGIPGDFDTENEVDVMMMHGVIPVFVSCKNGSVETEELYKLSTVAQRFGGIYAKKVLVATALDCEGSADALRQRARDMRIRLVENVPQMSDAQLLRCVKSFWKN